MKFWFLFLLFPVFAFGQGQSTDKISQLPALTNSLTGPELVPCVQNGVTYKCTMTQFQSLINPQIPAGDFLCNNGASLAYPSACSSLPANVTISAGNIINWASYPLALGNLSPQAPGTVPCVAGNLTGVNNFTNCGASQTGSVLYPQSYSEYLAGATPVSYQYPPGNLFRFFTAAQIQDVQSGTSLIDDAAAFMTALSVGGVVNVLNYNYRLASGITVTTGQFLRGSDITPLVGPTLTCDLAVTPCVTIGGTTGEVATGMRGFVVTRAAGTIPTGSVAILIRNVTDPAMDYLSANRSDIGFEFLNNGSGGLGVQGSNWYTADITDAHLELNGFPEVRVSNFRFGGGDGVNGNTFIRVTGSANGAQAANTLYMTNGNFNGGSSPSPLYWFQCSGITGNPQVVGEWSFSNIHVENISTAYINTDSSCTYMQDLKITNTHFNTPVEFFSINSNTYIAQWQISNSFFAGSFTASEGKQLDMQLSNNKFENSATITSQDNNFKFVSTGNQYYGGLTLSNGNGQFNTLISSDNINGLTDTSTASVFKNIIQNKEVIYACTNTSNDQTNIANLLATGQSVHLTGSSCNMPSSVSLTSGQCLFGDGAHQTFMNVNANFLSSASDVLGLSSTKDIGPCVHDLGFSLTQPPGFTVTTYSAQASGSSIVVTGSLANQIVVGSIVYDATHTGAIPFETTVTSITGTGPYTLNLNNTVTSVSSNDTINVNAARTNAAPLGTCDGVYIICEYPPVIFATSGRIILYNLYFSGAWNCVNTVAPADTTPLNVVFFMTNIECGALNIGLQADGGQDFSHIKGWHEWEFGWGTATASNAWHDGNTTCMQIGREDGSNFEDVTCFDSAFVLTANASAEQITNLALDGNNAVLEIGNAYGAAFNVINGLYVTGESTNGICPITVTNGYTTINNFNINESVHTTNGEVCISAGYLKLAEGIWISSDSTQTYPGMYQTGGTLDVESSYFGLPASIAQPVIYSSGGATIAKNNSSHTGSSGTWLNITADNAGNYVWNNDFKGYTATVPVGFTSGIYESSSAFNVTDSGGGTINMWNSSGATNTKGWRFIPGSSGTVLYGQTLTDAGALQSNWLQVTQASGALTDIGLGNTNDNPTFHWNSTGNSSWGGGIVAAGGTPPTPSAGQMYLGFNAAVGFTANGEGMTRASTSSGAVLEGQGSICDSSLANSSNTTAVCIPTGTAFAQLAAVTIANLPTCNSTLKGVISMVSNGVATPTYLATPSTTGTSYDLVACNGSAWQYH